LNNMESIFFVITGLKKGTILLCLTRCMRGVIQSRRHPT
jgi:hypothetical protein